MPSRACGAVFREGNIIFFAVGDDLMPRFVAPKLFVSAASVGAQSIMQADMVLVAAERRLIERADKLILLEDNSKFSGTSGNVVCALEEVDVVVTDSGRSDDHRGMLEAASGEAMITPTETSIRARDLLHTPPPAPEYNYH